MRFSKQKFFCNCCGKECYCTEADMMGGKFLGWRVCSRECIREIRWRETLSIMNKEYYPDPNIYDDGGKVIGRKNETQNKDNP